MSLIVALSNLLLWLQPEATGAPSGAGGGGGGGGAPPSPMDGCGGGQTLFMLAGMLVFMYFIVIRPEQKRAREREVLLKGLKKGDIVRTNGGIRGEIVRFENDNRDVILEIAPKTRINVFRAQILGREAGSADSTEEKKADADKKKD